MTTEMSSKHAKTGTAATLLFNTALMGKMRENIGGGAVDWDPGLFWKHGDEIANMTASLRDSAHDDDPSFNSAVNSLEFAYSQFSSSSFRNSAGGDWKENADHYVSASQAVLGALERFEPYC
jgi:hypothetical protein